MPEEQDVYADHDAYHGEHVKRGGYPVSHRFILVPTMLRHASVTTMLDAGVDLRDVQIAARYADPRTAMRYDRARKNLDRHPNSILAACMASGTGPRPSALA